MLNADLIREFADRACVYLSDIRTNLHQIETGEDPISDDRVDSMYQSIHRIVCTADSLDLVQISHLSRRLENVVDSLRHRSSISFASRKELILKTTVRLHSLLQSVESSNDADNRGLCEELDQLLSEMDIRSDALATDVPPSASGRSPRPRTVPPAKAPTTGPRRSHPNEQVDVTEISTIDRIDANFDAAQSGIEAVLAEGIGLDEGKAENR